MYVFTYTFLHIIEEERERETARRYAGSESVIESIVKSREISCPTYHFAAQVATQSGYSTPSVYTPFGTPPPSGSEGLLTELESLLEDEDSLDTGEEAVKNGSRLSSAPPSPPPEKVAREIGKVLAERIEQLPEDTYLKTQAQDQVIGSQKTELRETTALGADERLQPFLEHKPVFTKAESGDGLGVGYNYSMVVGNQGVLNSEMVDIA
eukprot:907749-Amorphochlora_amoeboformis.AAC.1